MHDIPKILDEEIERLEQITRKITNQKDIKDFHSIITTLRNMKTDYLNKIDSTLD